MPASASPRKPPWLRRRLSTSGGVAGLEAALARQGLGTICQEGRCPNRGECFGRGVATFLAMGPVCTRACGFCAVSSGRPGPLDPEEPTRLAAQVAAMGLSFVVVTSVTRDDLPDGGAAHLAQVVESLRQTCPGVGVELLVPDFAGSAQALARVLAARPQVLAHNLETVARLSPRVRPAASFQRSLELLARAKQMAPGQLCKSGLMLGLGESRAEVLAALADLRAAGCDLLTLGQYLSPSPGHLPVVNYVSPEQFQDYELAARRLGFRAVAAGPYVRSSYLAEHYYRQAASSPQEPAQP